MSGCRNYLNYFRYDSNNIYIDEKAGWVADVKDLGLLI